MTFHEFNLLAKGIINRFRRFRVCGVFQCGFKCNLFRWLTRGVMFRINLGNVVSWSRFPLRFFKVTANVLLNFTFRWFLQVLPKISKISMASIHLKLHLLIVQTKINRKVLVNIRRTRIHQTTEHALFLIKCSLNQVISLCI